MNIFKNKKKGSHRESKKYTWLLSSCVTRITAQKWVKIINCPYDWIKDKYIEAQWDIFVCFTSKSKIHQRSLISGAYGMV